MSDATKAKVATGRPTGRTPEIVAQIEELLIEGNSLAAISRMEGMPGYSTMRKWEVEDAEFLALSVGARARGTDMIADDALRIADDLTIEPAHKRIMVDTRLRLIGKWNAKVYGDKVQTELTGPGGGPVQLQRIERVIVRPENPDS